MTKEQDGPETATFYVSQVHEAAPVTLTQDTHEHEHKHDHRTNIVIELVRPALIIAAAIVLASLIVRLT